MKLDFEQLINAVGDAVIVTDREGLIRYWNPGATRIFGYAEEEALGHTLDLIIPERLRRRHDEGYAKSMETGTTRYGSSLLKVPAVDKAGRSLSIAFTVAMLHEDDGLVGGVAAVIRDETQRFAEDRELRKRVVELEAKLKETSS